MKIYILCQFNWYNLFLRIKKDRFPLFEHHLHITAQEKNGYELQDGEDTLLVKTLNDGTESISFAESPVLGRIYAQFVYYLNHVYYKPAVCRICIR